MPDAVFAIPGDIDLPTGGYAYDRRIMAGLGDLGVGVRHLRLPGSFPTPPASDLEEAARILQDVHPRSVLMIDGLAYGAMPAALIDTLRCPILALVHHPLSLEAGIDDAQKQALYASERAALERARHVLVTSPSTAATLAADFGVPADRLTVALPGTDPVPRAHGTGAPLQLLSVGSVVPRKAHDLLVRALALVRDRDWRLTIAGATDRDPGAVAAVRAAVRETGLDGRVVLHGPTSAEGLARLYAEADVLVTASLYEGYGMALAEALARGLPIVCTTGGAAAETVPDAAALKVPPGDVPALSAALARLLDDAGLRLRLADASWAAGQGLPRWTDAARIVAGVIERVARTANASEGAEP